MKAKKSKSTAQLQKKTTNTHLTISLQQLQTLYDQQAQLQLLKDKVSRSKPILETIYHKIRLKENRYEHHINRLQRKTDIQKNMIKDYKQLYEQGLRIMHRNKLVDKFKGNSNYRNSNQDKQNTSTNRNTLCEKLKKHYRNHIPSTTTKTLDKIKQQYSQNSKQLSPMSKQLIYSRYKQKIDSDSKIRIKERSPRIKTKQLSQRLLKQFDLDLVSLKKKDEDKRGIRKIPIPQSSQSEIDQREWKRKYLQIQKQKLDSI